jgi:hypothetical protein
MKMSRHNKDRRQRRRLYTDGKIAWDYRAAGSTPAFARQPDWMEVPVELIGSGGRKRRILRQYESPCPVTGQKVTTRELEGGLWCWESPTQGWLFSNRPDLQGVRPTPSVEDATFQKTTHDGLSVVESGDQAVVSTALPGVPYEVSAKAQLFLVKHCGGAGRVLIITPELLDELVGKGFLACRDGVYYLPNEV